MVNEVCTMSEILVTRRNGDKHIILLDEEDYLVLSKYKWCVYKGGKTFYTMRNIYTDSKHTSSRMHREIMNPSVNMLVDHINHNGLDNRKENLRICTPQENQFNCRSSIGSTSKYKGVCWYKHYKKWNAQIKNNDKYKNLGYFSSEIDAAIAYNIAATKLHGDFANLNIIRGTI